MRYTALSTLVMVAALTPSYAQTKPAEKPAIYGVFNGTEKPKDLATHTVDELKAGYAAATAKLNTLLEARVTATDELGECEPPTDGYRTVSKTEEYDKCVRGASAKLATAEADAHGAYTFADSLYRVIGDKLKQVLGPVKPVKPTKAKN